MKNTAQTAASAPASQLAEITELVNRHPDLNFVPLMKLVSSDTTPGELEDFFNQVIYALVELLKDEDSFTPHYLMQMVQQLRQLSDVMRKAQGGETWYYSV